MTAPQTPAGPVTSTPASKAGWTKQQVWTVSMRVRRAPCFGCGAMPIRDLRRRLCNRCYSRQRRFGSLPEISWALLLERLAIVTESGCWEWLGATPHGYGQYGGQYLHRVTYALLVGPIPVGFHIDHLCLNMACCNPQHLEAVTPQENALRAAALITHCPQDHPYDEANSYNYTLASGGRRRECRTCIRAREARRWARRKREAAA